MSVLIEGFKKDHKILSDVLGQARDLGIYKAEAKELLISARGTLLAHLEKEDRSLYPALKKAAQNDADLQRKLQSFIDEMEVISKKALAFFETYTSVEQASGLGFAKDFGSLFATLANRMRREEDYLYAKFDELAT